MMSPPWQLPDDMREELKKPLGSIYSDFPAWVKEGKMLIAVGDVVSSRLLKAGYPPDLIIFDEKTERKEINNSSDWGDMYRTIEVRNPPARITDELWSAIENSIRDLEHGDKHISIRVMGEEDLAALPCIIYAPDGALVVYGIPGKGAAVVRVDPEIRDKVNQLLKKMEV